MSLFWIAIGAFAFAAPHIATVGTDGAMAWGGLPFPAECAAIALALICAYVAGIPKRLRGILEPAILGCAFVTLVLEAVATLLGEGSLGGLAWGSLDEALHVLTATLWLLLAYAGRRGPTGQEDPLLSALVPILLMLSGAAWYLVTALLRYALPAWQPAQELLLWLCALLWAIPAAVLFATTPCSARSFVVRTAALALGVLLANRAWVLALNFGAQPPAVGSMAGALLAAPVLSGAALLIAWLNEGPTEPQEEGPQTEAVSQEAKEAAPPTPSQAAQLPLHLIPGYQTLSDREREVLLQTLEGATSLEIAASLGISGTTVRTYRARAYEKMNVAGLPELLQALRVSVEQPFPMPELPDPELSPAVLTVSERVTPKLASALVAFVLVLAVLLLRKIPSLAPRELVASAVFAVSSVVSLRRLLRSAKDCSLEAAAAATVLGTAAAVTFAALLLGPEAYLLRRTLASLVVLTALVWLTYRLWPLCDSAPNLALLAFSLVGVACVPAGVRAQALIHSTYPFLCVALAILAAALIVRRMVNDVEVLVAAATLKDDERVLAYLQGRGINDVMAQVVLLTARDYPMGGIAATVHISSSTVGKYRERAYKALGVKNKEELARLLEREAGLAVVSDQPAEEGTGNG